ncbi:MAG TPA: type III-A CRISPR-associated RAMP protein Csm3 [Ruminococcus sp.]|nr:type III-A CRISPR-associated RAMP protein Csm3 [Ruminococcus sp.]
MYSKLIIKGKIETVTGLHIGTGNAYSAIGAADSPVVRDIKAHLPMIPGSSFKGKLRTLLSKKYCAEAKTPDDDNDEIKELFGSMKHRGKLIFKDMFITDECVNELREMGIYSTTEVKYENTIGRLTAVANPRQIERVIRGCEFDMEIICDVNTDEDAEKSISILSDGMELIKYDYLGGNGSRGYGRIQFVDLELECVSGSINEDTMNRCRKMLKGVESE